jgi:lipoyl(octanoyl) transferase
VTSLSAELGRDVPVAEALEPVERHLARVLSWAPYDRSGDLPHPAVAVP